jgi:hypothetical protein
MIEATSGFEFVDLLRRTIAEVLADVRRQRRLYRIGSINLQEFWSWLEERCRFIFQSLGYGLGHADGVIGSDEAEAGLKERYVEGPARGEDMELGWLVPQGRAALKPIINQAEWTDLHVFDPLIDVAERLLNAFGVYTRLEGNSFYVDVPHTGWHAF